jgi:hypothetical protein
MPPTFSPGRLHDTEECHLGYFRLFQQMIHIFIGVLIEVTNPHPIYSKVIAHGDFSWNVIKHFKLMGNKSFDYTYEHNFKKNSEKR